MPRVLGGASVGRRSWRGASLVVVFDGEILLCQGRIVSKLVDKVPESLHTVSLGSRRSEGQDVTKCGLCDVLAQSHSHLAAGA